MTRQDRVSAAYAEGATLRDIAAMEDISHGAVRDALRRAGVEMRARGGAPNQNETGVSMWRAMCEQGCAELLRRQLETGAHWYESRAHMMRCLAGGGYE